MKKNKFIYMLLFLASFMPFVNIYAIDKVYCGNITNIPIKIPELTSSIITIVQIAVPIVLVIVGSLDLIKGISAQKEDELKKGQQMLIKRLVVAVVIFFVIAIVKFVVSLVDDSTNNENIIECIDCFFDSKKCKKQN